MGAAEPFDELRDPIPGVDNVIGELISSRSSGNVRLLHLRFREAEPELGTLVSLLAAVLVDYCLPLKQRRAARQRDAEAGSGGGTFHVAMLHGEAVRLLIRYNQSATGRYGEVGELISYLLAVHKLDAAQVASKMTLKTSSEMAYHGADGLHAQKNDDGTITFYFLESKLAPDANTAAAEFCKSVAKFGSDRKAKVNELRIVMNLSNLDALEGKAREEAMSYFDSYSTGSASLKRRERHVGSLVYTEKAYAKRLPIDDTKPIDIHEKNFVANYAPMQAKHEATVLRQAAANGVSLGECIVFLFAIPSIADLKKAFAEANGGHVRR